VAGRRWHCWVVSSDGRRCQVLNQTMMIVLALEVVVEVGPVGEGEDVATVDSQSVAGCRDAVVAIEPPSL
jgi:hypothetical protein